MRKRIITRRHLRTVASLEARMFSLSTKLQLERRPWADSTCYALWTAIAPLSRLLRTHAPGAEECRLCWPFACGCKREGKS